MAQPKLKDSTVERPYDSSKYTLEDIMRALVPNPKKVKKCDS